MIDNSRDLVLWRNEMTMWYPLNLLHSIPRDLIMSTKHPLDPWCQSSIFSAINPDSVSLPTNQALVRHIDIQTSRKKMKGPLTVYCRLYVHHTWPYLIIVQEDYCGLPKSNQALFLLRFQCSAIRDTEIVRRAHKNQGNVNVMGKRKHDMILPISSIFILVPILGTWR